MLELETWAIFLNIFMTAFVIFFFFFFCHKKCQALKNQMQDYLQLQKFSWVYQ